MAVDPSAGATISIGPTTAAADIPAYDALVFQEIGELEDLPGFGDGYETATFIALKDRRVRKVKTTVDAGDLDLTLGNDPSDAGQQAMKEALKSDEDFAFKVELDDSRGTNPTTLYFHGKVMRWSVQIGTAQNIVKAEAGIAINTAILDKPAA